MMRPMADELAPHRVVNAVAPIRICDIGGWTDTWFAVHGCVFNIGVSPYVEAKIKVYPIGALGDRVVIDAVNYGQRYGYEPGSPPNRHRLLEAAVDAIGVPAEVSLEISLRSQAPAGCSTGTSAAVTVALIGAMDALTPGRLAPQEIAATAHRVEVDRLGIESGIQDQLCAAYGGVNFIEMDIYPHASVSPLQIPDSVWSDLQQQLVVVFLGRAHVSSELHEQVIASLSPEGGSSPRLEPLRRAARDARDAVLGCDLGALGAAMTDNTAAQRELHPALVGDRAQTVIDVAAAYGALGSKVNGAGGEGGSLTILCGPDLGAQHELLQAVESADPSFRVIPTQLSRQGLRIWET